MLNNFQININNKLIKTLDISQEILIKLFENILVDSKKCTHYII